MFRKEKTLKISPALAATLMICCACARATEFDLSQYRGKVVYLDFWASWCGPCKQSFPWLAGIARSYASKYLVVVAVNVDMDRSRAEQFLNDYPAGFPVLYDPAGEIATAYKVTGMPTAVLIDRVGHVRFQHSGFLPKNEGEYDEQLRILLGESAR